MKRHQPSGDPIEIVIVDADPAQRRALTGLLNRDRRIRVSAHASRGAATAAMGKLTRGVVIADLETVGGVAGLSRTAASGVPVIATSATPSLNTAIEAVKNGAVDFLPKPIGARALLEKVMAAVDNNAVAWQSQPGPKCGEFVDQDSDFAGFVGKSAAMTAVYEQIRRVAGSAAPVFITGESGTGKEVCAEAIHDKSGRRAGPFIAVNCSAIPADLMESEMFGHIRGAFTGAIADHRGAAEQADGGTLFLDEIGELDLSLQAKLLRFLQANELRRVGDTKIRRVDVRILCATNRDPHEAMASGRLRADLFYRLHVIPLHLPPLRERPGDVGRLADCFRRRFAHEERRDATKFSDRAAKLMDADAWPGNVRQLANVVRRMVVLSQGGELGADLLPPEIADTARPLITMPETAAPAGPDIRPMWRHERAIIEGALSAFSGNVTRAAAALEINPSTVYRKRQSWAARSDV